MLITSELPSVPCLLPAFSHSDARGKLLEISELSGLETVNVKVSFSREGVVRGLHCQEDPCQQAKIVRVCAGAILDVAVNLSTGDLYESHLDAADPVCLYVPEGYAHGFEALADNSIVAYVSTNTYDPTLERAFCPLITEFAGFSWRTSPDRMILSAKDRDAPRYPFPTSSLHFRRDGTEWIRIGR
jgi:dTDP-4-dehydrorhamnose 3,5-epimerase